MTVKPKKNTQKEPYYGDLKIVRSFMSVIQAFQPIRI